MRKNIYNDKILMVKVGELEVLLQQEELFNEENEEVLNRIREYFHINIEFKYITSSTYFYQVELALSLDDKINKKIEEIYGKCTKGDLISVHEVYKAFNWALFLMQI